MWQLNDEALYAPYKIASLVDVLAELGVPAESVLADTGLAASSLQDPGSKTSIRQLAQVCRNAMAMSADPSIAFRAGHRMHVSSYGMYGYALMCCETLRAVKRLAVKFHRLATPTVVMSFREEGAEAVWSFDDVLGLHEDDPLYRFLLEYQFGIHLTLGRDMLGDTFRLTRVRARHALPAHAELYGQHLGCQAEFEQPCNELRYPAQLLDHPAAYRNAISGAMAAEMCERMMVEFRTAGGVTRRVYEALLSQPGRFSDMEALARRLNTSVRTLRRHLSQQGTSYQQILDDVRCQLAKEYLRHTRMTIDEIAGTVGFSDPANFRQAFRRWTRRTPSEYRG